MMEEAIFKYISLKEVNQNKFEPHKIIATLLSQERKV